MQTTRKPTGTKARSKIQPSKEVEDDKKKIAVTPRNYLQKASTTDIYGHKNAPTKTPKKTQGLTKTTTISPMRNLLKSSASSVSQISRTSKTSSSEKEARITPYSARKREETKKSTPRLAKDLPFSNVTVNSPGAKKKLDLSGKDSAIIKKDLERDSARIKKDLERDSARIKKDLERDSAKVKKDSERDSTKIKKDLERDSAKVEKDLERDGTQIKKKLEVNVGNGERQRTKTRTLQDNEVKVLTPEAILNNEEMMNLSRKLTAKPKAFYVDLEDEKAKPQNDKTSDEDVSYEDDFESYESDFDSYHSSHTEQSSDREHSDGEHHEEHVQTDEEHNSGHVQSDDEHNGQTKENEEKMLDSGNFDLRESQRSATRSKQTLDFIQEAGEADVRASLTDEGFQEMSSSSAASSMRTVHVDVLDRPLFIDFSKAKENKRKRRLFENLRQRAKDILSMVTFHEMSYTLFEMKPIRYDLYMATFGRSNYIQTGVQTFEDGISDEVQTEEIEYDAKWTQHPIEFSSHDIYITEDTRIRKYSENSEDYLSKFTLMINKKSDDAINNKINDDLNYKLNPLRIYFEQKDGAGDCKMLPYETYKSKLRGNEFNASKLKKFLKKVESRVSHVLGLNVSDKEMTDVMKSSKFPFSKGYVSISNKNITDENMSIVKYAKITNAVFSDTKSNLIMTVHSKSASSMDRCVACLWDLSVARREPVKILIAIDAISIARFRGNTDGIFTAALEDGSIHLWDLSEEATWQNVASGENPADLVDVTHSAPLTQTERDREWNLQNSNVGYDTGSVQAPLQACSFTSSAASMNGGAATGRVVGLEMGWHAKAEGSQGRKVVGQVCSLQSIGILSIWSIIQDKLKVADMGKAFWSKMKLEITQRISLTEHLNVPKFEPSTTSFNFNLNAAKRRLSMRKKEKPTKKLSRPKSAVSFDSDRPMSASVKRRVLPAENNWENGIVCSDLKIMNYDNSYSYLIARNCGEVLCCSRTGGLFKVNEFRVSSDTTTVTSLAVSPGLPYFLAATAAGTVHLCSVAQNRALLTLDCRNLPPGPEVEKYIVDPKGRFVSSVTVKTTSTEDVKISSQLSVDTVLWCPVNPCRVFARLASDSLHLWDLAHSDIHAKSCADDAAVAATTADGLLAIVTPDGEVQVHRVGYEQEAKQHTDLFSKYAALL